MKISENKPHSIHLRLSNEQYDYCRLNADLMGVGVSDFIRMTVNSFMVASEKLSSVKLGDLENADNTNNKQYKL